MTKAYAGEPVIRHSIRGRLRVKMPSIWRSAEQATALAQWLAQQTVVERVEMRPQSASIILYYKPEAAQPDTILQIVSEGQRIDPLTSSTHLDEPSACCSQLSTNPQQTGLLRSLVSRAVTVVALTGLLAFALVRKLVAGKPLSEAALSPLGVVATLSAAPLLSRALKDWRAGKRMSLFPFLTGACLLAVLLGQALTALEVLWVTALSMLLEDYVADRSRRAIRETLQVATKNTFVLLADGTEVETPVDRVRAGDTVAVHAGERVPVDGAVLRGKALVDEAHITGRSQLELHSSGDRVFAGTSVQNGILFIRAEQVGDETYLNRMLHLVEQSLANRAAVEKQADVFAARLVRIGALTTVGTLLLTGSPLQAFTVLVVMACPCAAALGTATAVTAAIANAAHRRILVKGGLYLEKAGEADCFCFDKTGTLTLDVPQVVEVVDRSPLRDPARVLALAATAEAHNPHPLARAILQAAARHGITPKTVSDLDIVLGRGVRAEVDGDTLVVGSARFLQDEGTGVSYFAARAQKLKETGQTVVYVARNGKLQGMIVLASTVDPGFVAVLDWLRRDGVDTLHLVTGDTEAAARHIRQHLDFDDYRADLLPEDKARYMADLRSGGRQVVMVGDGVNDALALSRANIGIAMGRGGAELASEAGDIVLVDSNPDGIVILRQLSHQALRVAGQNYWLAVSTNLGGVVLGLAGWLTPLLAGLVHVAHTLGIMLNSSRLLGWAPPLPAPLDQSFTER